MASSSSRQSISSTETYRSAFSLIIYDVPTGRSEESLCKEIYENYPSVIHAECLPISKNARFGRIGVYFSSAASMKRILDISYMLIGGKRYSIKQNSTKAPINFQSKRYDPPVSSEETLTKTQLASILEEHTKHIENLIKSFEKRWNENIQEFQRTPVSSLETDRLMNVVQQLSILFQTAANQQYQHRRPMPPN